MTAAQIALTTPRKLGYAVGGIPEGVKSVGFEIFVLFYYNQVVGLPGSLCGLAIAISLVTEACINPFIGSISDSLRSKWGRRHPFMFAASIPFGLSYWLMLNPPHLGEFGTFLWFAVFATLVRGLLTTFQVPYLALGAEMAPTPIGRTQMYAWRQSFEGGGTLAGMAMAFGIFFTEANGGRTNPEIYTWFSATIGVIGAGFMLLSAWLTRWTIPCLPQTETGERVTLGSTFGNIREAFRSRSFLALMAFAFLMFTAVGLGHSFNLYIYEYFWSLSANQMLSINLAWPIGLLLGALVTVSMHRIAAKRTVLAIGAAGWALGQLVPVSLQYLGVLSLTETQLTWFLTITKLSQGLLIAQALVSMGSMIGDIAEEQAVQRARRQEGVYFGLFQFFKRLNGGIGGLVAGIGLDLIHWPAGQPGAATGAQLNGIAFFYGPATASLVFLGILCLGLYRLGTGKRPRDRIAGAAHS